MYRNRVSLFWCATLFCLVLSFLSPAMSLHKWRVEKGGELLVAKLLIVNISNKATGMLNISGPLEAYPSEGSRWNPFQTWVKPALLCSVGRADEFDNTLAFLKQFKYTLRKHQLCILNIIFL